MHKSRPPPLATTTLSRLPPPVTGSYGRIFTIGVEYQLKSTIDVIASDSNEIGVENLGVKNGEVNEGNLGCNVEEMVNKLVDDDMGVFGSVDNKEESINENITYPTMLNKEKISNKLEFIPTIIDENGIGKAVFEEDLVNEGLFGHNDKEYKMRPLSVEEFIEREKQLNKQKEDKENREEFIEVQRKHKGVGQKNTSNTNVEYQPKKKNVKDKDKMERRNLDKYTKEQDYTGKKVDKKANDKKRNMEKFANKYAVLAKIEEEDIDNLNEIKEKSMVDSTMFCLVEPIRSNHKFFVTIVYGSNNGKERKELWSDLQNQSNSIQNKPYALMGDFNVTLRFDEHSTGEAFATTDMQDFQKLDRIMVNEPFMELFKDAYACFFPYLISDHSPVILSFPTTLYKKNKAFKFENYVANKDEFITVVKNGWELQTQGFELYKLVTKLKNLKKPLNHLNWKNGNLTEKVERLSKELKEDEEKLLCQQAKVDWLKEGDKSSAYFHKIIKGRRHQNHIPTINDEDGADVVTKDMEECNIIFDNQVSTKDALGLIQEVTDKEIHNAICDTDDNKAPGPDGFTSTFYKKAWPVIRKDMCRAIKEFFTKGSLLKELNATLITLVPKIPNPSKVSELTHCLLQCNSQVKDNKIDLLVQQYEQFVISEDESIDNVFARFNTIITSLKAFDEGYSSKNYVKKFLRALHPKWRAKIMTIEE
ncbi:RNA-directed DNA polymerase, eukaryota, reverse transcriptase zinc-binding domain protein [Tanacetum coccineum]